MSRWTPLERVVLGAFLFWFACGFIFTIGRIGPVTVHGWNLPWRLEGFVALCVATGDPLLILLAFANTHLLVAREWGPGRARRWALTVLTLSLLLETCGALTGFPFGAYRYSDRFGPVLGVVPLTIPLAWHVVITNALLLVRSVAPRLPRAGEAAAVGTLAALYDGVLEPFATRVKDYWQWKNSVVPAQNYVAWFALGALLVGFFAPTTAAVRPRDARPAILLGATIVLFLAGRFCG